MTVQGTSLDGEPGGSIDELLGLTIFDRPARGPRTLKQLAARIAAIHRFHGVTVSFRPPGRHAKSLRVRVLPKTSDPLLRITGRRDLRVAVR
jgi:hypothetical protein